MKVFKLYCISACLLIIAFLSSCSDAEYRQAIPKSSTALVSFDVSKISGVNSATLLKVLLRMKNLDESGIDLTHKIYLFESPDGNLGICAKVQDKGKLEQMFVKMNSKPAKYREAYFAQVSDSWIAGYNDQSLLIMGPLPVAAQEVMKGTMAKYLQQDEENSVIASPIFEKLESIISPMAMVAQAKALPEQLVAPMTLGSPKGVDGSQVLIAAEMSIEKRCLTIEGRPFSFNQRINQEIEESFKVYCPITDAYLQSMSNEALLGMFVNVDGQKFLPILQQNKGLQVLLTGINQAIDMDNIIRSVDGDMCIIVPNYSDGAIQLSMAARLAHTKWLADVPYWKQSVPQGARLTDVGKNIYSYSDGKTNFCFGVSEDKQFFSGSSKQEALASIGQAKTPLPEQLQNQIKGQKMVMVIHFNDVRNETMKVFVDLLKPVFGPVNTMVYKLK